MDKITVGDLKDQMGMPFPQPMLKCFVCGSEFSGHRGDYFMAPLTHVFTCCNEPTRLVTKHTVFEPVLV